MDNLWLRKHEAQLFQTGSRFLGVISYISIYKGILEGIACELSTMTGIFERTLGQFSDIYATGGGTLSLLGMRLRAAMTERRFHLMSCPESVCLGGAILAAVAVRHYPTICEASSIWSERKMSLNRIGNSCRICFRSSKSTLS